MDCADVGNTMTYQDGKKKSKKAREKSEWWEQSMYWRDPQ